MDRETLIRLIVERVMAVLAARGEAPGAGADSSCGADSPAGANKFAFLDSPLPAMIAVFCGPAPEHLGEALDGMKRIRERANLHLIFSHTFCQTTDTAAIERALTPALVCREVNPLKLRAVLPRYKALLAPALGVNTLAKLCAGITDSAPTVALFEALGRGLPVFAAREGVDPEWLDAASQLARPAPAALRPRLYAMIGQLEQWGAQWMTADALAGAALALLEPAHDMLKKRRAAGTAGARVILTRDDVGDMLRAGRRNMTLPPGAIVTDAAREFAEENGVRLDRAGTDL